MTAPVRVTVIPTMRYRDAPKMIDWLCKAFGFEKHFVVPGDAGTIAHAQLTFGNGMIMCGSARDDDWGKLVKPVADVGTATGAAYVSVRDVDAHYARAKVAGAEIESCSIHCRASAEAAAASTVAARNGGASLR
jgi:uncharacterized glyoxalase superfamily protein PhnB